MSMDFNAHEAAWLLKEARNAQPGDPEAVEWALAQLPDNRHARALGIRARLDTNDVCDAETLLAQTHPDHADHPKIRLLAAEVHLRRGKLAAAARVITDVLNERPQHADTLRLAARIAAAQGDEDGAIAFLARLTTTHPTDANHEFLVDAYIDADDAAAAECVIHQMQSPSITLRARVMASAGRTHDALDLVRNARRACQNTSRDPVLLELHLQYLEACGHHARLAELITEIDAGPRPNPTVLLMANRCDLSLGHFEAVIRRSFPIRQHADALAHLAIAAWSIGRLPLARRGLERLHRRSDKLSPPEMALLWARATVGSILTDQRDARNCRPDRDGSVLLPIIRSSLERLDQAMQRGIEDGRIASARTALAGAAPGH